MTSIRFWSLTAPWSAEDSTQLILLLGSQVRQANRKCQWLTRSRIAWTVSSSV